MLTSSQIHRNIDDLKNQEHVEHYLTTHNDDHTSEDVPNSAILTFKYHPVRLSPLRLQFFS